MVFNLQCAVLRADEIHAVDERAAQMGVPPFQLMQQAANALANAILQRYPLSKVLVVCGPGNNGGDGFGLAKLLAQRGWSVHICTEEGALPHSSPAKEHAQRWVGSIKAFEQISAAQLEQFDLIIDAGFGIGLSRVLNPTWQSFLQRLQHSQKPIIAIDVPTGLGATGTSYAAHPITATLTLALFKKKLVHILSPGRAFCGEVVVCDIGLEPAHLPSPPVFFENQPKLWWPYWQQTRPDGHSYKYRRGQVMVFGGPQLPGAPCLSALGAAVAGAGLVSILTDPQTWPIYAAQMQAVMVRRFTNKLVFKEKISAANCHALVLGPGALGVADLVDYLGAVLATHKPCVLDAEALNILAQTDDCWSALHANCVLTPHEGEFKRLFPQAAKLLESNRVQAVQQAAQQARCVVVLKGAETLIALDSGEVAINNHAGPYLATAGSGDVLAGVIAAFLAQGVPPFFAATMAVWLHGEAGYLAGVGLTADALPHWLVQAQQKLVHNGPNYAYNDHV